MSALAANNVLAFGWQPQIKGIVVVAIAIGTLMGSVYLLLMTNLGARLGFLVAVTALLGWITIMATIWWVYGIGLKGKDPFWRPLAINSGELTTFPYQYKNARSLNGWKIVDPENPARGQATAAADTALTSGQSPLFKTTGDYAVLDVYDRGGGTYPKIWFPSFFHRAHYAIVQVQPVVPQLTEPGKAPPRPVADASQPVVSILMVRNLGNRRRPAA